MLEAEQVQETSELLQTQVDALIRRVASKDDDFAKERKVLRARAEKAERSERALRREVMRLKSELAAALAKSGGRDAS